MLELLKSSEVMKYKILSYWIKTFFPNMSLAVSQSSKSLTITQNTQKEPDYQVVVDGQVSATVSVGVPSERLTHRLPSCFRLCYTRPVSLSERQVLELLIEYRSGNPKSCPALGNKQKHFPGDNRRFLDYIKLSSQCLFSGPSLLSLLPHVSFLFTGNSFASVFCVYYNPYSVNAIFFLKYRLRLQHGP